MKEIIKRILISNFITMGTPEFGKSFEHYILMELKAYQVNRNPELEIRFWRTTSGFEVDFVLNDAPHRPRGTSGHCAGTGSAEFIIYI